MKWDIQQENMYSKYVCTYLYIFVEFSFFKQFFSCLIPNRDWTNNIFGYQIQTLSFKNLDFKNYQEQRKLGGK